MACLVLFVVIEGAKPVGIRAKIKALEDRVKALEETCTDKRKR